MSAFTLVFISCYSRINRQGRQTLPEAEGQALFLLGRKRQIFDGGNYGGGYYDPPIGAVCQIQKKTGSSLRAPSDLDKSVTADNVRSFLSMSAKK